MKSNRGYNDWIQYGLSDLYFLTFSILYALRCEEISNHLTLISILYEYKKKFNSLYCYDFWKYKYNLKSQVNEFFLNVMI